LINTPNNTFMFQDGAVFITSSVAGNCTCGRSAFLFISRNGRSACLACDARRLMIAPTEGLADEEAIGPASLPGRTRLMHNAHSWPAQRVHRENRLQRFFLDLMRVHLQGCSKHIIHSDTVGMCISCQAFVCKICSASEPFKPHFTDLPDHATTQQVDQWFCEVISQGDIFAGQHSHGKVN
jgi:hypothetical protein